MGFNLNDTLSETYIVSKEDLISDIDQSLPNVLGTYTIVKWAEITSAKLLLPHLNENELSVGIRVDIKHTGISLIDHSITVITEVTTIKGPMVGFEIIVSDKEETIAKIKHTRVLLGKDDLQQKMDKKV